MKSPHPRADQTIVPHDAPSTIASDRRSFERTPTARLRCSRGRIVDLSTRGARIATCLPWRRGRERFVTFRTKGRKAKVLARCVWVRKAGPLRRIIGVAFMDVDQQTAHLIEDLAYAHACAHEDRLPIRRAA